MDADTIGLRAARKPVPHGVPLPCAPGSERCAHPDCTTRLSRYNPDPLCSAHGGWSDETVLRPGRKPAAGRHPVG